MDAEVILDRRRLRRKTTFWRIMAFMFAITACLASLAALSGGSLAPDRDHVARIAVDGFIPTRPGAVKLIRDAADSSAVKAIVLRINSPGGAATGGEALYRAVRDAGEKKPIVAVIDGLGTSAAYMTAIGTDYIVARESAITSSIGVIFQFGHFETLMEKVGVEFAEVKSAPLKGQPSPFTEPSDAALAMLQAVVDDTYDWFVGLVVERRDLPRSVVEKLADGSILTGRQAKEKKLVDELGGEDRALAWLSENRDISADLPVKDWRRKDTVFGRLPTSSIGRLARLIGLQPDLYPAVESVIPERLMVDGLLSVWQASDIAGQVTRGRP
jgi:protease-4